MEYPVIVRPTSENRFVAEPMGRPELQVVAATEEEALEGAVKVLDRWLDGGRVVHVRLPDVPPTGNPWLDASGRFADDPQYEEFLEELARARAQDEPE